MARVKTVLVDVFFHPSLFMASVTEMWSEHILNDFDLFFDSFKQELFGVNDLYQRDA